MLSPEVTPSVIEELTEALERERRRTRELEQAHAALVERAARRHELVARLSHELRTPITVILGMAQTLAKADETFAQRQELAVRIVERSEALARLVERFELTIDAGMAEKVDVAALAEEVASPFARVRVIADGGPFTATLSPVLGRRILGELVTNGLEFSPPDAAVTVQVARGRAELEVRVVDAGPGIDADDRERIFGFLEQVEDLNVRVHQGLGFGLSLARGAARSMGGDVVLESSGPEGSTFLWTIDIEE